MPEKKIKIKAQGHEISIIAYENQDDYISLTDIARQKSDEPFIKEASKNTPSSTGRR